MKKALSLLLIILLIASMAAACSPKPATPATSAETAQPTKAAEPVTLTFSLWDENQAPVMKEIIKKFEEENKDIKVEVQLTPWSDYWTKLDAAAGAGKAADVLWMNVFLPKYVDPGVLVPLDEYIAKDKLDLSQYVDTMVNMYNYNGKQYALPKGMDTVQVFYNKAIFDKYGVAYPKAGWTWDDMAAIGNQLKAAIKAKKGTEYPLVMELDAQPSHFNFVYQTGGYVLSPDGKTSGYNTPENVDSFKRVVSLMDNGIMPSYTILSDTKGTDLFISQKAAMIYMGSWKAIVMEEASIAKDIGVITMPAIKNNTSVLGGLGYVMTSTCENKDAAWKLIKYLAGYESNKMQAEGKIDMPALKEAQKFYAESFKNIDANVFFEATKTSVPFPTSPVLAGFLPVIEENAAAIFAKKVTPEEGCKAAYEGVQKILDEHFNK